jgi:phospholipid/cholesterol/gamma-HCH transport system substrate-binding protein
MLSRLVKNQLRVFIVISAAALSVLAIFYVQIPAQLGIGRYKVDVELKAASGLYPKANVTYRGFEVGTVRSVELKPGGRVVAHLEIDNGADIPADAVAQVRSASVIGEQYVNFLPPEHTSTGARLKDGAVVPMAQTSLPTTTDELLTSVDDFLKSIPQNDLRTVVNELGTAFDGTGGDLGNVIDAGGELSQAATDNLKPTTVLIRSLAPVLRTQQTVAPDIRRYAKSLDTVTAQLQRSDKDLRAVLASGSPTLRAFSQFTDTVGPQLIPMLHDVQEFSAVLSVYVPGIEHIITVLPAAVQMYGSGLAETAGSDHVMDKVYFKMSFPTACTKGFPDKDKIRSPYDLSPAPLPQDSYCKVAPESPLVVRGARNNPCPNNSARRGPTAASCGLIFDATAVRRDQVVRGDNPKALVAPQIAKLLAPNGSFFLLDPEAEASPTTWTDLMMATVQP